MQLATLVLCLTLGSDFQLVGEPLTFALVGPSNLPESPDSSMLASACPNGQCSNYSVIPNSSPVVESVQVCGPNGCSSGVSCGASFETTYEPRRMFRRGGLFRGRERGGACRGGGCR